MTDTTGLARPEADIDDGPGGFGSLWSITLLLACTWVAALASFPLNDNSFFTHLATGRLILDERRVPSTDPYSFTAEGEPWTVQSWLASVVYAGAERVGNGAGLRIVVLVLFLGAAAVVVRLARPARSAFLQVGLVALTLIVATDLWGERPFMFGVIGLGLVLLALDGELPPVVLVPVMWIWVNTHGSFPLALVLIITWMAGTALDRRAVEQPLLDPASTRVLAHVAGGILLGGINPIGPRILWFPLSAVSRSDVFADVIEWQPPDYRLLSERAFLVLLGVTVLWLVRTRRWQLALPATTFGLAAVYAQRNIVMAAMVLVAVAARCAPEVGQLRSSTRPALGRPVSGVLAALAALVVLLALASPVGGFGGYPVRALAWMEAAGEPDGRLAGEMFTGNMLGLLDGAGGQIFIDDRVDMFPPEVFRDYLVLARGGPAWAEVLDRYEIDGVVWSRRAPLGTLLALDPGWTVRYSDAEWVYACRRSTCSPPG